MIYQKMFTKHKLTKHNIELRGRKIYGIIIALSLIVSLEHTDTRSIIILLTILGSLFTIALAEVYIKRAVLDIKKDGQAQQHEIKTLIKEEFGVLAALSIPLFWFFLEIFHIINRAQAFAGAKIFSILALFLFGYELANAQKKPWPKKIFSGLMSAVIGSIIIGLKILVH